MRPLALLVGLAGLGGLAACDGGVGGGDGLAFDIDLVDACPVPDPFFFGMRSVELQLRGDDNGSPCIAARRCVQVPLESAWDPDSVEAALRAAAQPLLSTEGSASTFKIIGSDDTDCTLSGLDVFFCGVVSLDEISGGVLEVPVECAADATAVPVCPVEALPDCPAP